MRTGRKQAWAVRGVSVLSVFLMSGCMTPGPTESELQQVRAGELAIVLIHLSGTTRGEPFNAVGSDGGGSNRFYFGHGRMDTMGPIEMWFLPRRFSPESAKAGWAFFALEPGQHLLTVRGSIEHESALGPPAIRVEVPPGEPVIYAGSLDLKVVRTRRNIFGGYDLIGGSLTLSEDLEGARRVAAAHLGEFDPPRTVMMRLYDKPLPDDDRVGAAPILLSLARSTSAEVSAIQRRAIEQGAAPGLAIAAAGLEVSPGGGDDWLGALIAATLFVGGMGIAGIGATLGAIFGGAEQAEWEKHLARVSEAYVAYDMDRALNERLGSMFAIETVRDGAPPATAADRPLLQVIVSPLLLRTCEGDRRFCFELLSRVRQWDPAKRRWSYDRFLLYSNPLGEREPSAYVRLLAEPSPVRSLNVLKSDDAPQIVANALDGAMDALARRIRADIGMQ